MGDKFQLEGSTCQCVKSCTHTHPVQFGFACVACFIVATKSNKALARECESRERESRERVLPAGVTGGLLYIKIYMANGCENPWKRNVIIKLPDDLARE